MTLYEIKSSYLKAIEESIDDETGEIVDLERITALEDIYEDKIDNIISIIKSWEAEGTAIKGEEEKLSKRRKSLEKKAESLKGYLETILAGEKFKNERHSISYRASESLEVDMEKFMENEDADFYLTYKKPEPNKTAIKKALKDGITFDGVNLISKMNMQIK